jgi:NCS1 family nucleobase:cation symporter-1
MGILIASSSEVVYGEIIWDPIQHLARFLENDPSHAERFGVAVIALCFVYVQLILNLSANSIGAGCDMTALRESEGRSSRGSVAG